MSIRDLSTFYRHHLVQTTIIYSFRHVLSI